jgi:hypothetical protein
MTVGHPEWPPTLLFLRNSLIGDVLFTGGVALVAFRSSRPAPVPA